MFTVTSWTAEDNGDVIAETDDIGVVKDVAGAWFRDFTVESDTWKGVVVVWTSGRADPKWFPGCDEWGFGGVVPSDARNLIAWLNRKSKRSRFRDERRGKAKRLLHAQTQAQA